MNEDYEMEEEGLNEEFEMVPQSDPTTLFGTNLYFSHRPRGWSQHDAWNHANPDLNGLLVIVYRFSVFSKMGSIETPR